MKSKKKQVNKFRELAREVECDESETAFDEKLKKLSNGPLKEDKTQHGKRGKKPNK